MSFKVRVLYKLPQQERESEQIFFSVPNAISFKNRVRGNLYMRTDKGWEAVSSKRLKKIYNEKKGGNPSL
jgi:hypothetical protein